MMRRSRLISLKWIICALSALSLNIPALAAVFKFDMGKTNSPVRPGFEQVTATTAYSPERGWGWKEPGGLTEHDQVVPDGWRNKGVSAVDINEDMIYSDKTRTFLVNAPAGQYRVYIISGASGSFAGQFFDFNVSARDATARIQVAGNCEYRKTVLDVAVNDKDGPLAITFTPKNMWLVNGIIIYPIAEEAQVRKEFLDDLELEVWTMPLNEWKKWEEAPNVDTRPMPKLSDEDQKRGYLVYVHHYLDVIYPNTIPRPEWLAARMKTFACPDEFEPLTFAVYPLRAMPKAKITVSDLRSAQGAVIAAAGVDVRHVRYMKTRLSFNKNYVYKIVPDLLERFEMVDLKKGRNERFWLTIHVPADAVAGAYEGTVTFKPDGGEASSLPLKVKVLPIVLKRNPARLYSIDYLDSRMICRPRDGISSNYFERKGQLERQDIIDHGIFNHPLQLAQEKQKGDTLLLKYADLDRDIQLYLKSGFEGPVIINTSFWNGLYKKYFGKFDRDSNFGPVPESSPFLTEIQGKVAEIESERKKRNWPEFIYYPIDEPGGKCMDFAVQLMKAFRNGGGRTFCTLDPSNSAVTNFLPYLDVLASSHYCRDANVAENSKKYGTQFLVYPNFLTCYCDRTPAAGARMTTGFGLWRSGYNGFWIWKYHNTCGDPFNYLDGEHSDVMIRSAPDGELIPNILWECMRAGVDDDKYLYTLEAAIAAARKSSDPKLAAAADEAEQTLREIKASIKAQEEYVYENLWAGPEFDVYRGMLAAQILKLQTGNSQPQNEKK